MRRSALLLVIVAALTAAGCAAGPTGPTPPAPPQPGLSATTAEPAVAVAAAAAPRFRGQIAHIGPRTAARMRRSWRPGCPVGVGSLRRLIVDHWGFDGRVHRGELVVHHQHAGRILGVLQRLFTVNYRIQRMRLVDAYGADDDRSMAANNTSGFNCRFVSGTRRWSEHARGLAIDLNPLINPYVTSGGRVSPPGGWRYLDRALKVPGMIRERGAAVRAFDAAGWHWGGRWRGAKDYQHFSATGR